MKLIRSICFLFSFSLLFACTSIQAPPLEVKSPEMGMAFRNISSELLMTELIIHEYGGFYLNPLWPTPKVQIYPNGDFIAVNLPPGKYYIASVTGSRGDNSSTKFKMSNISLKPYQHVFTVKPGDMKYVGSFRISGKLVVDKNAKSDEFSIRWNRLPGEREILRNLFEITSGTGWQQRVDRRLKELRV